MARDVISGASASRPVWQRAILLVIVTWGLAGCAAQTAYREGRNLIETGNVEAGIVKLREAVSRDPSNVEYRQTYLQLRDESLASLCGQADRKAQAADYDAARRLYQRALSIEPGNDRAQAGLKSVDAAGRHAKALAEAQTAWNRKDRISAEAKLRQILEENPQHAGAQALTRVIRDAMTQAPLEAELAAAYHKPITLEFKDASIKQVFDLISRISGLSFYFDKDVRTDQRISVYAKKGTVESALHFLLLTNQLDHQVLDANTVLIYPNTPAKQKDYQELLVRSFYLANADAKTVANTLKTLLKLQDVIVDDKLNMVLVRDSPAAIRLAEKIVALHDVPEPEVMLEVEILEIKRSRLLSLGVQWPDGVTLTPLSAGGGTGLTLNDLRNLDRNHVGVGIAPVTINAKKQDADASILANPRIRAGNHEKAKILIGDRVPNITTTSTSTGFVSESINYVDIGLKLEVEPTIHLDGDVNIKIALEVSNIVSQLQTKTGAVAYQIGTRNASTVLNLKDGENQVLAGLINDEDRQSANKIPLIGELPVVGRLFGSKSDDGQKTEIVLSITPHLIRNIRRPSMDLAEFESGTGSTFRLRPEPVKVSATGAPAAYVPSTAPIAPGEIGPNATTGPGQPNANPVGPETPGGDTYLMWSGPAQTKVGDTFSLRLMMQSGTPVSKLPLVLNVDPKVLQPIVVNEGSFLKKGDGKTRFTSQVEPNGQIQITVVRDGDGVTGDSNDVVTVDFRALAPVSAAHVQLLSAAPVGPDGKPVNVKLPATYSIAIQR